MKAVVLKEFGGVEHFKLEELQDPMPQENEVRISVKSAGFNPVDYKMRKGYFAGKIPLILGADCSGVIDAVGKGVTEFAIGDEVYAMPFGQCSNGSYAEKLTVPASFVAKKPKQLSFHEAAAIPLAAMTAYRALFASSAVKRGDRVFIAGAGGGVGCLAVQMAQHIQAAEIFTVAGSEESARFLVEAHGLKRQNILIYKGLTTEQMVEKLIAMNQGELFEATFDLVGQEMKRLCLQLTKHSGHFATIVPEQHAFDFSVWQAGVALTFQRNLSLHFIFVGSESMFGSKDSWQIYSRHLKEISQMIEKGALKPQKIEVVGNLSVEAVAKAHHLLEEGKVKGKLVMRVQE